MNRVNSTHFASQEELAGQLQSLNLEMNSFATGGIPLLVKDNVAYVDASDSHTMIYGATGSKKTRMFAMPTLGIFARGNESFVVTDPKGELYERTAGDVSTYGYNVQCMNLRNFMEGFSWNPLSLPYEYYHNGKKAKAMEFVAEMASMIIGEASPEDSFWVNTGRDVFGGFILLLFELANKDECNLRSLAVVWNHYLQNRKSAIRFIKENYANTIIYQKISSLDNQSERTVGSIEAFINMGLNKLSVNEEFMDFLSKEGSDLEELVEEKMAIYLVIPDENKTYHFVVSLFLEQLYEVLIHKAQREPNQRLPRRVNFLIDEFGNIPKIDNMEAMITAARSRNIRFHLIVQGMKQLKQKYGEGAEIITGNCNNWIYLYSKEFELLQEISRLCGEVIYDNNMRMPLFSEFDLQHLSKEKGEALVLAGRNCPCISNLADIDDYPFIKKEISKQKHITTSEQIRVFNLDKKQNNSYCYPIDDFEVLQFCGMRMPEITKWVVGTGPNGMILVEGKFSEMRIKSEYAFQKLLEDAGLTGYMDVCDLEWYSAENKLYDRYKHWLKEHPGVVCPLIDLLGKSKFTLRRKAEFRSEGKYCIKASLWDEKNNTEGQVILSETIEDYGGMLGLRYAHNEFFCRMNGVLEGTEFEKVSWQKGNGEDDYENAVYFEKRIGESTYVLGCVQRKE
ncbi:MAG: type IV secretory system conjugative DNA transfer family protein [Lachnospiraceae bacterium]|nr:type IV secretory system conjugative DNA transfer family protein [Lachnospiraceae bacterium]